MDKEKVLDYVMNSPGNSNRAVLSGMLDESGGGNPNRVETYEGTVANLWNDIDRNELATALENHEVSIYLEIDASALNAGIITSRPFVDSTLGTIYTNGGQVGPYVSLTSAYQIAWDITTGNVSHAYMHTNNNVIDISSYTDTLTTSMTIVWHPLPTE